MELDKVEDEFNEFQIRIYDESPSHLEPGQNFDVVQFNGLRAAVDVARQSVDNWKKEVADLLPPAPTKSTAPPPSLAWLSCRPLSSD